MHRGPSRCVMDISGQSSGTDHIRTRSAEVCLLLKRPLDQSNCICPTLPYLFTAPLRCCRESLLNFYFPNPPYVRKSSCSVSAVRAPAPHMETVFTRLRAALPFSLSFPPSEEKVKWPHMSRSVTSALSGG